MTVQLLAVVADLRVWFALAGLLALQFVTKSRRLQLPPGPKRYPLLGNVFNIPRFLPWVTFHNWAEEYNSGMIYLQLPFQPIIVVDSVKVALDLMDKRSRIYSDKPISVMDELTGWEWNLAVQRYGPSWRATRRYFHQYFYQGAIRQYHEAGVREIRAFLRRALQDSTTGISSRSLHQTFSAVIMDITYGIRVYSMDDEYVRLLEYNGESFGPIKTPGTFWIDSFPLMKYVPAWVPGAAARKFGEYYKPIVLAMREKPFLAAKIAAPNSGSHPSIVQKMMKRIERLTGSQYSEHENYAKDAAGVAYVASVETSLNATSWFLVAMAMHVSVQNKARHELDTTLGTNRLPEFDDLESLPYLKAIYMETLRWMPVVPLGVPHRVMEEDEYNGQRILKGSIIIPNAWAMLRNPDDYPNPECFDPDRVLKDGHIDSSVRDPATVIFGFGRRICPGRYFAAEMLLLTFASVLSVFEVLPATDQDANQKALNEADTSLGILLRPKNLDHCVLKPRSVAAIQLVKECEIGH